MRADANYRVYGWSVSLRRKANEFSTLSKAGRNGFAHSGSCNATVNSAPVLKLCRRYVVKVKDSAGTRNLTGRTRRGKTLAVKVNLGPANPFEQYTAEGEAAGHLSVTAEISFKLKGKDRCGKRSRHRNG